MKKTSKTPAFKPKNPAVRSLSAVKPTSSGKPTPTPDKKPAAKAKPAAKRPLDLPTKAWVAAVNEIGKLRRGAFERKEQTAQERVKAIFLTNKKAILELWQVYTQHRDELSRKLINNREYTVSYLLGFHLANVARATDLFTKSNKRHHWNKLTAKAPVRLYDIGCGTGAMSIAFLQNAKASEVLLYDGSGPLLDAARFMHEQLGTKNLRTSRREIEDLDVKWFQSPDPETVHVYLLGYIWNELNRNNPAKRRIMDIFAGHIKRNEKCLIFIAEPALEQMSRPTMELRDILCSGGFQALYPCPHSNACPMLERPKDWCYSEGVWDRPDIAAWIDDKLDLDRGRNAGTQFAFASPAMNLKSDGNAVVVGRPVREEGKERYKGFFDYLVCGNNGIEKHEPLTPKTPINRGQFYKESSLAE